MKLSVGENLRKKLNSKKREINSRRPSLVSPVLLPFRASQINQSQIFTASMNSTVTEIAPEELDMGLFGVGLLELSISA